MTADDASRDQPDTSLPKFSVNVVSIDDLRFQDLRTMLKQFRAGNPEPLVFGEKGDPEAVVIPFSAFVRLMRHDHEAHVLQEHAFQGEVSRRVQESDAARARGEEPSTVIESDAEFEQWVADSFGEIGREWIQEHQSAKDDGSDG